LPLSFTVAASVEEDEEEVEAATVLFETPRFTVDDFA